MSANTVSSDGHNAKDLQHYLAWVTRIAFGFAALFGAIFLLYGDFWMGVIALATFGDACMMLVAYIWAGRGQVKQAVVLICIGLLAIDLLTAVAEPISLPTLVILPLLAVAVAITTLSPMRTTVEPWACLASFPVSKEIRLPPARSIDISCFMICP